MPDPTPSRPPLWRVMVAASVRALFDTSNGDTPVVNCRLAAELRAIADWLVPEEERINLMETKYRSEWIPAVMRDEHQRLRLLLLAEADRAEAGE